MAHTIKLKRTSTAGNKPDNTNITTGELALNTADKSLYLQTGTANTDIITLYDDGILHLDDTNNRVGIGTTSPSDPLHVVGAIRSEGATTSKYLQVAGGNSGNFIDSYANDLFLRPNGNTSQALVIRQGGGTEINGSLRVQAGDAGTSAYSITSNGGDLVLKAGADDVVLRTGGSGSEGIYFQDGAQDTKMFINAENGNVGIGTTSPSQKLHIDGNIRVGDANDIIYTNKLTALSNASLDIAGNTGQNITFKTGSSERVRINSNGQLGIGVTDFTNALHSNGKQLIIGSCFVGTSAALVVDDFSRFAGPIYFHQDASTNAANSTAIDNNGSRLVITGKNGNTANALDAPDGFYVGGTQFINSSRNLVNIGTITSGNITANISSGGQGYILQSNSTEIGKFARTTVGSTVVPSLDGATGRDIHIGGVVNTDVILANAGGSVGIATTSPVAPLDVRNTTGSISSTAVMTAQFRRDDGTKYPRIQILSDTDGSIINHTYSTGAGKFRLQIAQNDIMTLQDGGNVGIGTTSPAHKLDVNGTFRSTGNSYFEGSNINFSTAGANVKFNGGGGYISTTTAHALRLQTNNTEALRLTSGQDAVFSGDITVSKDDPTITLLNNSGANTDPNGTIIFSEVSGTNNFKINYNGSDDRLEFIGLIGTTETDLVYINRSTAPAVNIFGELHVGGHIKTTANSYAISSRKIAARDTNGLDFATSDGTSRVTIANNGTTTFNSTVRTDYITGIQQTGSFLDFDDDTTNNSNGVTLSSLAGLHLKFDTNNNDSNFFGIYSNGGSTPIFKLTDAGAATFNNAFTFPTTDGSANQVLKTDGSGNVTWATEAAASIQASIADADGDTKIQVEEGTDDDTIRFDTAGAQRMVIDSTGNVGINTSSITKTLNVGGTFLATGEAFFSHFDNMTSSSRMRDNLRLNFGTSRTFAITGNSTNMHVKNGTTNVMTFDTSNRVGISTDSPNYLLDIESASSAMLRIHNTGSNVLTSLIAQNDLGTAKFSTQSGYSRIHSGSTLTYAANTSTTYFYSSGTEKMRLSGTGLRIGTATDTTTLEFPDKTGIPASPTETNDKVQLIKMGQGGNGGMWQTTGRGGMLISSADDSLVLANGDVGRFYDPNGGGHHPAVQNETLALLSDFDIRFTTGLQDGWSGGTNYSPKTSIITADGRFGVGTTAPATPLHVRGTIRSQPEGSSTFADYKNQQLYVNTGSYTIAVNGPIHLADQNNNKVLTVDNGNDRVGIGTTSPTRQFHVQNASAGVPTTYGIGIIEAVDSQLDLISDSSGTWGSAINLVEGNGTSNTDVWSIARQTTGGVGNSSLRFNFGTTNQHTNANKVTFTSAGNVGIGGSEGPGERLAVNGNTLVFGGGSNTAGGGGGTMFLGNSESSRHWGIRQDTSRNIHFDRYDSGWATRVTFLKNGNVGIGTSSPQQKLDVTSGHIQISNTSSTIGNLKFFRTSTNNGMEFRGYETLLTIHTLGGGVGEIARFQRNTGNVGIGTTSPSAKLQVEELGIDTTTTTTSATTQVAIDTMAAATFRSARYTIQITNTTDSSYHITEVLLIHDGTTPAITEYGTVFTGSAAEATIDADISSGNVRLLATPASTDSMTFKVVRHCITV